ncbi:hypothetical protein Bca52824_087762 [Brassica carinata]|uniref:CCHC-type domain-containing protein n=1 Tax=Brassica carinata TaxID=52824 RepID=A0A8X7P8S7_BRACI|nr:hypothetical protein Bca52824_087762 [Brassica carinata]
MEMLLIDEKLPSISKAMAEVTETVDQMRRNRWLPGRSDYYMCGEPGYMVRDCLEDTEAVVATVDGQEEVVATRWSQVMQVMDDTLYQVLELRQHLLNQKGKNSRLHWGAH